MEENNSAERVENEVKEGEVQEEVDIIEEVGVKLMLRRINFFVFFFGATVGLVYINNLGQIAESRDCSNTSSLVSLSSSFGFFGRLMPSLMYFFYWGKCRISRPASLLAVMVSTSALQSLECVLEQFVVSTTTELFRTKHFSVNHNVVVANIPISSFIFGYSAALVYRKEGHGHDDQGQCMGMEYQTKYAGEW
ncbi:protein NUCLEAR FUSION DEFECTIVE 4-like [Phaseolus vulgaris]|uniref:protein NUCLEAR FUSION DEFECTIVE 4-like n=1 Tax=Phaseolus vulgaris TaxID=3885 RepID=UPI0035CB8737